MIDYMHNMKRDVDHFLAPYVGERKSEDKEEILAFLPEDVPEYLPNREAVIETARRIMDELEKLTYKAETISDVQEVFKSIAFYAGAVVFDMEADDDGEDV